MNTSINNAVLLSICIPTYNRCRILEKTIHTYTKDPSFDDRVEIVISDNYSTDNTMQVLSGFARKYRNIKYNRLPENIGADYNMSAALNMGQGKYLKLMNDTVTLNPGALEFMLKIIGSEESDMKPIFFYQNISFLNSNKPLRSVTLNKFVRSTSFWSTWISNFGVWRAEYERIENKNRCVELQFTQTDWTFRIIKRSADCTLYFGDYYRNAKLRTKGGYDVFKTFGVNYLSMYKEYIDSKYISTNTYRIERYRLFRYFLMEWYVKIVLSKEDKYHFESKDALKWLFKTYKTDVYFYFGITYMHIKYLINKLLKYTK